MAGRQAGIPGWVRATGIVAGLLVLVVIAMVVLGHNPLQHIMGHASAMQ